MQTLKVLQKELRSKANPRKANILARFFKTGKGEYGEGDRFLGLTVPETRMIAVKYHALPLRDVEKLLSSPFHEERLAVLLLLVSLFQNGNPARQKEVYRFYMRNARRVNNWDLVDLSADKIVGAYLLLRSKAPLYKLAASENLWERRIAIVATFHFIRHNRFTETLILSKLLLRDRHDLIHKAVGWMLREVGKRDRAAEERFLAKHHTKMPRVMLRYAVELLSKTRPRRYLQ